MRGPLHCMLSVQGAAGRDEKVSGLVRTRSGLKATLAGSGLDRTEFF